MAYTYDFRRFWDKEKIMWPKRATSIVYRSVTYDRQPPTPTYLPTYLFIAAGAASCGRFRDRQITTAMFSHDMINTYMMT